jgi:hypothetical protein
MAEIKKVNGRPVFDYMARDYDSLLQSMREQIPQVLPEWTDYESEADFGNVLLQLFAHMGDILSYYQDRIANESFLGTAQTRRSIIHHLRLIGYKLATAAPAAAKLTVRVPTDYSEEVVINKGDAFATPSEKDKPSIRFEYTGEQPVTIDFSNSAHYETRTDPETNVTYKISRRDPENPDKDRCIPVEEGRLIQNEIIGESDGSPNQRFFPLHSGLILRSMGSDAFRTDMILTVGSDSDLWHLRESLAFSQARQQDLTQRDFTIEIDENDQAMILFGDGEFGAIPPSGAMIRATYRVGGGRRGNVSKGAINTIADAPQLAKIGAKVTNPEPATGGEERESIEHAVQHAPGVFRSRKRAVTQKDYEDLALDFRGVGKVRAKSTNWNIVKLYVAPQGGGRLNDVLIANLLAYFEDKRPLTTIIEIEDVDYVKIYVTAEIAVESYYDKEIVKEKVLMEAGKLLASENVDFGQVIYLSKFYEAIEAIDGVAYVTIIEFGRERNELVQEGKIELKPGEIPRIPGTSPGDSEEDATYGRGVKVIFEREVSYAS